MTTTTTLRPETLAYARARADRTGTVCWLEPHPDFELIDVPRQPKGPHIAVFPGGRIFGVGDILVLHPGEDPAEALAAELDQARRTEVDENGDTVSAWAVDRGHMVEVEEVDTDDDPHGPRRFRWVYGPVEGADCHVRYDGTRATLEEAWAEGCAELAAFIVGGHRIT